jgi:hypothetical protein
MDQKAQNEADRICALALIRSFTKKYCKARGIPEQELKPYILRQYFGGQGRRWGAVLHNKCVPTRLDMQCLRASIGIDDIETIKAKSIMIRQMEKEARHGEIKHTEGAKEPLRRRDGSIYEADSWKILYEELEKELDKAFGVK